MTPPGREEGVPVPRVPSNVLAAIPLVRDTEAVRRKAVPPSGGILGVRHLQVDGNVAWQRLCISCTGKNLRDDLRHEDARSVKVAQKHLALRPQDVTQNEIFGFLAFQGENGG